MKMHILSGGRVRMKKSVYVPEAGREETIELPVSCYLLRHTQGNVLFDTGCHPSTATDAESRWGLLARVMVPLSGPEDNVIDQLRVVGLVPDDIDVVVNSHFHSDHCGCNEFFKKATVICHARELEVASSDRAEMKGYLSVDWKQDRPVETIDGQKDLFNDGRIVLLPMPGHTPGMTGALVSLQATGSFYLASDSAPLQSNLDQDVNPRNTALKEDNAKSMAEIRRIQAGGATVLFGHDDAQWQTLRHGLDYYD